VAAAQREVIDTQILRCGADFGFWQVDDQPQQRATVHRDTQRPSQPGSRPANSSAIWDSNRASGTLQRW